MVSAREWVRQMAAKCEGEPLPVETVLKLLERQVGHGEKMLLNVQAILDVLDRELIERNDGPVVRQLWLTVMDYYEKVLEARAAA
jgi:hypothetical protein